MLDRRLRHGIGQMTLERIERLGLIRWTGQAMAHCAERSRHHHATHSTMQCRVQQVASAEDIVGVDLLLAARDGHDLCRTMIDAGSTLGGSDQRLPVAQITENPIDVEAIDARIVALPSQQDPDLVAVVKKPPHEIGSKMSVCSCEKYHGPSRCFT